MEEKFYVTEEGLNDLKKELDTLIHVTREEVIEELKAARALGDLSENADYDAARDHQAKVESRIKELEHQIKNAEIISDKRRTNYVRIGSTVLIKELDTGMEVEYKIVGSVEADPLNGLLSNVTPLAEAIMDRKVNDVCQVAVDQPYEVKILKIS
ncbi:MAG: transcription elongation factor GreA [Erysipelotrichaceae bacterium]|nr:transcription elongation factor GreA [Erysipelotrichaceae bacterium]MBQ1787998.1 transcription elongation factor GreA [Erysipelotrichaceae bacterium]